MASSTRPNSQDVARLANVSRATVSYVLNRVPDSRIPEVTRQRVLDAAAALGYIPHASAQALAAGRSRTVLVDLSDIPFGETMARTARLIAEEVQAEGLIPIIDQLSGRRGDRSQLLELATAIRPVVVITAVTLEPATRAYLEAVGVSSIVSVFEPDELIAMFSEPGRLQVRHLVERGHKSLAYAPGTDPETRDLAAGRRAAADDEARRLGLPRLELVAVTDDIAELAEDLHRLVTERGVTAVAAYNDEVALEIMAASRLAHLVIPQTLAVIGVEDLPFAALVSPSLSTIRGTSDKLAEQIHAATHSKGTVTHSPRIVQTVVARQST